MFKLERIEEAAMTLLALYLIINLDLQIRWWLYLPLFFTPDIGLAGLFMKNKAGTILERIFTLMHSARIPS